MTTPDKFEVSVPITAEIQTALSRMGALAQMQGMEIDSSEAATMVSDAVRKVKERQAKVKAMSDHIINPFKAAIDNVRALFTPMMADLVAAEEHGKKLLTDWQETERKRVAEENARQAQIQREAQQRADADAARIREEAKAKAEEQERQAAEQRAAAQRAIDEGNAKAAATAKAAAAKLEEQAKSTVANADIRADAKQTAAAAIPATIVAAPEPISGFGTRDNWIAEISELDETVSILRIIDAVAGVCRDKNGLKQLAADRPELIALLKIDMPAANKMAKALKKNFNVPGLKAINRPIAASRKAS